MKKYDHFLVWILMLFVVQSCHLPMNSSEKWIKQEKGRYKCTLTNDLNIEQRRNTFPFDKAETILFIAYENHLIFTYKTKTIADTSYSDGKQVISTKEIGVTYDACAQQKVIQKWQLKDKEGENVTYCAIESIKLNQMQIDSLSNFLLNYKVTMKGEVSSGIMGCYNPRNAIIFLDKSDNPIRFIEICFECFQMYGSDKALEDMVNNRLCLEKLSKIKDLFTSVGIHYGTDIRH